MTDLDKRKGSVTKQDFVPTPDAGVWSWSIYDPGAMASPVPQLPIHGSRGRDQVLTATLDLEDMWASAIAKAVSKIAVRGYEVSDSDDSTRRTEFGQNLVRNLDGPAEYRGGVAKIVQDFLLCDNGWFVEVARVSKSPSSKVRALYPLDSFRCFRTGNLDYPVLYLDWDSVWHKLRPDQVIFGSDMPSPRSRQFGRGRCAAGRAFQTIIKLSAVETYFREKITGSRALSLHFIMGVNKTQLQDAMETSEAEKIRKNHVLYKGAVMIPMMPSDKGLNIATVELASVPDGFDVEQVQKDGYKKYAIAIGLNPDELVERAAGLNSGQSAQVAEQAAEEAGGLPYFIKDFEDKVNYLVMPKQTVFQISTNDIRDQQMKANLNQAKATTIITMLGSGQAPGIINQQMALQMAVDEGLVPPEFLPQDVTPQGTLTDSGDQSKAVVTTPRAPYAGQLPAPQPAQPTTVTKTLQEIGKVAAEVYKAAGGDEWEEVVNAEEPEPVTIIQPIREVVHQDRAAQLKADKAIRIATQEKAERHEEIQDITNQVIGVVRHYASQVDELKSQIEAAKAIPDDDWQEAVKWAEEATNGE